MSVKVIPISQAYRDGWERVFGERGNAGVAEEPHKLCGAGSIPAPATTCRINGPVCWVLDAGLGGIPGVSDAGPDSTWGSGI